MDVKNNTDAFKQKVIAQLERTLRVILLKLHADADAIIRKNKAIGRGELIRNLREDVYIQAGKIIGVFGVGANVPYGIFRHEGTKPHFPPIEPIAKWVVLKGLFRNNTGKVTTFSRVKKSANQTASVNAIAFLIARKISKKGTTGLAFLKLSLQQNTGFIESTIRGAFSK